ncbi:MAG: rhomboid family intramembrane serine protease [Gemmatimonadetes bacterium]|nr:rhomboid family intramembrane serine protease [Gemmatimonadota bacterium]
MTPVVLILVLVNIAAYLLQSMVPGLSNWFAFVPAAALVRPWTVVTYMFLHGSLSHIGFNMLALYFFGPRIEDRMGSQRFATLYFASGITGALLSMLFSGAPIIGASGGVFGVMLAFAFFWPNDVILLWGIVPVPARVLVIGTTVLALFSGFSGGGDGIAHFAHLGGYAGAFLYLKWLERGRGKFRQMATSTSAPSISHPARSAPPSMRTVEGVGEIDMSGVHEVNREAVTRIVDKVQAQGLASLTAQEKSFLRAFLPMDEPRRRG